jgi:4-hydroxybenzoate polyprenyltransferase
MINIIKALRLHQWVKNFLIFIPFVLAHGEIHINILQKLFLGFFSFSLCASGIYIVNDLFDLKNDQKHFTKKYRPLPSGAISVHAGITIAVILISASFFLARKLGGDNNFLLFLIGYFLLSFFYSLILKKFILLDCVILSILYTLRLFSGGEIANVKLSFWLINFSIFFFLSLAFVKRYNEIFKKKNKESVLGRGYYGSDKLLIKICGINAGFMSVLILTLYINSETIVKLYKTPEWMWGSIILILFWINWLWIKAHRNQIDDDPVIFALKDKTSILTFILLCVTFLLANN